jgi:hypothetical protein
LNVPDDLATIGLVCCKVTRGSTRVVVGTFVVVGLVVVVVVEVVEDEVVELVDEVVVEVDGGVVVDSVVTVVVGVVDPAGVNPTGKYPS